MPTAQRNHSILASLALGACLLLAGAQASFADHRDYPTDNPAFSFDLPTNWVTEQLSPKVLICQLKGNNNVGLTVTTLPREVTTEEFKDLLPKLSKGQIDAVGKAEIEMEDPTEDDSGRVFMVATAKYKDVTMTYKSMCFTPVEGRSFVITTLCPANEQKHEAEVEKILASIEPSE
jgi:hypothetical protein